MEKIIYADHSATTPIKNEVLKEMLPYFKCNFGNASSNYSIGRISKAAINKARRQVASAIGCDVDGIYFTSGGSESDNLALKGIAYANKNKGKHIITSKIEHLAILNTCKKLEEDGFDVTYLDVNKNGIINLDSLKKAIRKDTILISIMMANNEIGTLQPIDEIGKIAKEHDIIFHTDAVQAIGAMKIDVRALNIDSLSLSGHKFYGPKGIGALYVKKGINFEPIIHGGHQELCKRAGTENIPNIVGLGKAIEIATSNIAENTNKLVDLRDLLINKIEITIPNVILNGDRTERLPGNVNFCIKGIDSESLLLMLDMNGICASSGSACTSGDVKPSHVLKAIGLSDEVAKTSVRFTLGTENSVEDVDNIAYFLKKIVSKLRNKRINKNLMCNY